MADFQTKRYTPKMWNLTPHDVVIAPGLKTDQEIVPRGHHILKAEGKREGCKVSILYTLKADETVPEEQRMDGAFTHDDNAIVVPTTGISLRCEMNIVGSAMVRVHPGVEVCCRGVSGYEAIESECEEARKALEALGAKAGDIILVSTIAAEALERYAGGLEMFYIKVPDSSPTSVVRDERGGILAVRNLLEYIHEE